MYAAENGPCAVMAAWNGTEWTCCRGIMVSELYLLDTTTHAVGVLAPHCK